MRVANVRRSDQPDQVLESHLFDTEAQRSAFLLGWERARHFDRGGLPPGANGVLVLDVEPLHLWAAEVDFVIAESAEAAAAIFATEPHVLDGGTDGDGLKPEHWKLWPDEKPFTFHRDGWGEGERRPAGDFVREFGRGYFASSEY